jgi:hypothetical protein
LAYHALVGGGLGDAFGAVCQTATFVKFLKVSCPLMTTNLDAAGPGAA